MEAFLFSSDFENQTGVIFSACDGLSNAKEVLIISKVEKVLGVTYLLEIVNWELGKGRTKRSQVVFVDSEYHTKPSHLALINLIAMHADLINFTVTLLDSNRKKLTFP